MDDGQLRNVWNNRRPYDRTAPLSVPLDYLLNGQLAKRVKQLGQLAVVWDECIPDFLLEHASMVSFTRGILTVAVDSAPHRYQLQQLLGGGLLAALRERFRGGALNRVRVVPGQYDCLEFPNRRGQA